MIEVASLATLAAWYHVVALTFVWVALALCYITVGLVFYNWAFGDHPTHTDRHVAAVVAIWPFFLAVFIAVLPFLGISECARWVWNKLMTRPRRKNGGDRG